MSDRRRFRPAALDGLEGRLLLARAGLGMPVVFAPSNIPTKRADVSFAATDQINQAFDGLTRDYLQAQGAYFASDQAQGTIAARFFRSYIVNRVELLSQQLTRTFTTLPGALAKQKPRAPSGAIVLRSFLTEQIKGKGPDSLLVALAGPTPTRSPIPPVGTSGSVATLYTDQALTAIEAARVETLNNASYLLLQTSKHSGK